ncbi:LysR family transcriptional regulator [Salibacterium salarium]|uniref:LysR family transcriptional regulator n=1 Tax=Salibacterium salarium TaxID=284579 RepID=UPI00163B1EF2|nr:LysR family transcriptional regulator [Salibacterium salarium]
MQIHQLEYVVALERYLQFSTAAHEIAVTQSTISDQIKKLENELGIELFIRSTRKVQVTPAGKEFLVYAKRILNDIDSAKNSMLEHSKLLTGKIRIGAIANIRYLGITSVITAFQKKYPGLLIEIHEENSDNLLKQMDNLDLDVAFLTFPYDEGHISKNIDFFPLVHDKVILLVANDHPLADRKKVSISEIEEENILLIRSSTALQNSLLNEIHKHGIKPNVILESHHVETIKVFVEEGLGVTFFQQQIARSILNPQLRIVEVDISLERTTGLGIPKGSSLYTAEIFRDFVLNSYTPPRP